MHGRFKRSEADFVLALEMEGIDSQRLDGSLSYAIRDLHRRLSRALQGRIAARGVSMGQWLFLRVLCDKDGLTQRELSQRAGMMEPTTVAVVNVLEQRGLVRRVRNAYDRRKINVFLTEDGRALRGELLDVETEVNEQAVRGLAPGDVRHMLDLLRHVAANMDGCAPGLPLDTAVDGND